MKLHYLFMLESRNSLFEFKEISHLMIYAHFINTFIKAVLLRNNFKK